MVQRAHAAYGRLVPLTLAMTALATPLGAETGITPTDTTAPLPTAAPVLPEVETDQIGLGVDRADRMTLPVEISGVGPYHFIIDTGSQRSIIATELAQELALPGLAPVNIVSMAGRETVASVQLNKMKFGSHEMTGMPLLSIARANIGSAGLIGLDGLKDKRVTLDFRGRKLEVSRSLPPDRIRSDAETIVVEARRKQGQLIMVGSKVDGQRVSVIIDTGAEISIGNMALFNKLKAKRLVIPPTPTTLTSVTGEEVAAIFTVVRRISIEAVQLENVPMVFLDAPPFAELDLGEKPAMLLGMKMLRMFDRVGIDFGSKHVDFHLPRGDRDEGSGQSVLASLDSNRAAMLQ